MKLLRAHNGLDGYRRSLRSMPELAISVCALFSASDRADAVAAVLMRFPVATPAITAIAVFNVLFPPFIPLKEFDRNLLDLHAPTSASLLPLCRHSP